MGLWRQGKADLDLDPEHGRMATFKLRLCCDVGITQVIYLFIVSTPDAATVES